MFILEDITTFCSPVEAGEYNEVYCVCVFMRTCVCVDYVIVTGGVLDDNTYSDDIELLIYKQLSHWVIDRIKLPEAMWIHLLIYNW